MSSTLQLQLDPKVPNLWAHFCYGPPEIDDADNVQNDFFEKGTNKEGFVDAGYVDPKPVWVLLRGKALGYTEQVIGPIPMPHAELITVPLERLGESGFLRVRGGEFITEDDQPWCLAGYASYTIISEIAKSHEVGWFFDEAIGYGANTIVALGMDLGQFAHDHDFAVDPRDPHWVDWLATLCDLAAAKRMRLAPGLFQQAQSLSTGEQFAAWQRFQDVLRGRWNLIGRAGNEHNVNGWDYFLLPRPINTGGVLYSTGSRGINNPPEPPNWDFAEWEPPREPRAKTFSDAGGAGWYMKDGYPGFAAVPHPLVCIEPPFFHETTNDQYGDFRWCSPADALTLGANIGANFAGGVFGSSESLETRPNGPIAADCARQFFRGLRAGFVR